MPLYEYRCPVCQTCIAELKTIARRDDPITCTACGTRCVREISGGAIHLSAMSKVERADPKYDRMVDQAMRSTTSADPDHYLKRMRPYSDASDK